jgi:hypothetical protein
MAASQVSQLATIKLLEASRETLQGKDVVAFVESHPEVPQRFKALMGAEEKMEEVFNKLEFIRELLKATAEMPLVNKLLIGKAVSKFSGIFDGLEARMQNLEHEIATVDLG